MKKIIMKRKKIMMKIMKKKQAKYMKVKKMMKVIMDKMSKKLKKTYKIIDKYLIAILLIKKI